MRGVKDQEQNGKQKTRGRKGTLKFGKEVIRPYKGKEELPEAVLDSKGKVIKPGEPRHFLARQGNNYKLVRVYRARGIKHGLVRMVKPYIKGKPEDYLTMQIAESGSTGPIFSGPHQYPFVCRTERSNLGQPLVDNYDGFGIPVYVEDDSRPLAHKNCYMSYYRNRHTNNAWKT